MAINIKNGIDLDSSEILDQLKGNTMEKAASYKRKSLGARFRTLQQSPAASHHNKSVTKLSSVNGSFNKFTIHNIIVKKNVASTPRLPENWSLPPITGGGSSHRGHEGVSESGGDAGAHHPTLQEQVNSTVGLLQ